MYSLYCMNRPKPEVIQKQFAGRISQARVDSGLSQEEAASILNMARSILSEYETGKRPINISDLEKFAEAYRRDMSYFMREHKEDNAFAVLLRASHNIKEISESVSKFESYCHNFEKLSELLQIERKRDLFDKDLVLDSSRPLVEWIEHYCDEVRGYLSLGSSPVPNLRDILEEKLDLKVFNHPMPESVSGIFTYSSKLGGCIFINSNNNPGRQLFSLAHEFGHFLFHKKKLALISIENSNANEEKTADLFAENFLMPSKAIKNSFYETVSKKDDVSEEDVLYLADLYGVSFKAMVFRLKKLKLISSKTADTYFRETFVNYLRDVTGLQERPKENMTFPKSYRALAVKAYRRKLLTVGALSEMLDLDIWSAKKMMQNIPVSK